jgi:hypothetical protein
MARKAQRPAPPGSDAQPTRSLTRAQEATQVERLTYTRTQAAEALGVSRFNRRVLPLIETVEMPWGTRMIPAASYDVT